MPNLPVPQFPDVPALPGVPALARAVGAPVLASVNNLLINAGLGQFALGFAKPVWGVFDTNNQPVAIADSVRAVQFRGESNVPDYPLEQGGFQSYNKVQRPFASVVSLACGGDEQRRANFLSAIEQAKQSTNLYSIVMPEVVYNNANIVAYDYRREQKNGATLLTVDLHIEEIRVNATAAFANVQNPASADTVSQGQVQATTPGTSLAALYGPVSGVL
ncbi:MAG: hypothetical protein OSB38_15170 [Paraburkholderia fungorum]|nr:hypothetical protein [Paraburkholderia fungorum]